MMVAVGILLPPKFQQLKYLLICLFVGLKVNRALHELPNLSEDRVIGYSGASFRNCLKLALSNPDQRGTNGIVFFLVRQIFVANLERNFKQLELNRSFPKFDNNLS